MSDSQVRWAEWLKRGRWVAVTIRAPGPVIRQGRILSFDSYGVAMLAYIRHGNGAQVSEVMIPWESIVYIEDAPALVDPRDAEYMRLDVDEVARPDAPGRE